MGGGWVESVERRGVGGWKMERHETMGLLPFLFSLTGTHQCTQSIYSINQSMYSINLLNQSINVLNQAEADKAAGVLSKGAKKDSEVYAAYRLNVTNAGIASEYDKKRRTLVVRGGAGVGVGRSRGGVGFYALCASMYRYHHTSYRTDDTRTHVRACTQPPTMTLTMTNDHDHDHDYRAW